MVSVLLNRVYFPEVLRLPLRLMFHFVHGSNANAVGDDCDKLSPQVMERMGGRRCDQMFGMATEVGFTLNAALHAACLKTSPFLLPEMGVE